jgi:haloalkane dehalogenase
VEQFSIPVRDTTMLVRQSRAQGRAVVLLHGNPTSGHLLIDNFMIDVLLPAALMRPLSAQDMETYREPYPDPVSRRALLAWTRQIPINGDPPDTTARLQAVAHFLSTTDLPLLLVHGQPGVLIDQAAVDRFTRPGGRHVAVDVGGPAGHFLPEDRPAEVASALLSWVNQLP